MGYRVYPKYKDSGFEWLGRVPAGWEVRRLKFSSCLINEKVDAQDSTLEYLGLEHIESWTGMRITDDTATSEGITSKFSPNDVLFGKLRPYLAKVWLADGHGVATTEALVIRPNNGVIGSFLKYFMLSCDFIDVVNGSTYGSKMPRANWDFIGNLSMLIPAIEEQRQIAQFLDHKTAQINRLIEKKQELIERLQEQRTTVITQTMTKGLNGGVALKDSGIEWLGEIPAHWKVAALRCFIAKMEQGWSPSCEDRPANPDEWAVLKSGCVNGGVFRESEHKTMPQDLDPPLGLEVRPGDILMCRASGSRHLIGSVAKVNRCREKLIFSDKTYRITVDHNSVNPEFFTIAMRSKYMRDQIELSISGAEGLANNIPQSLVKSYIFAAPSLEEQNDIINRLKFFFRKAELQEQSIREAITRLQEYRTALITAAVTGQIDVRDWQAPVATEEPEADKEVA